MQKQSFQTETSVIQLISRFSKHFTTGYVLLVCSVFVKYSPFTLNLIIKLYTITVSLIKLPDIDSSKRDIFLFDILFKTVNNICCTIYLIGEATYI